MVVCGWTSNDIETKSTCKRPDGSETGKKCLDALGTRGCDVQNQEPIRDTAPGSRTCVFLGAAVQKGEANQDGICSGLHPPTQPASQTDSARTANAPTLETIGIAHRNVNSRLSRTPVTSYQLPTRTKKPRNQRWTQQPTTTHERPGTTCHRTSSLGRRPASQWNWKWNGATAQPTAARS